MAWTAGLTTVMVLPNRAFDPINVPKLLVLAVGGFIAAGALFTQGKILFASKYRGVQVFSLAFMCDLLLVLVVSGTNFTQEFFGTFGRATGFLAYFSLLALFVAAVLAADFPNLSKLSWSLILTGAASIVYGLLQSIKADPVGWVSSYNPVMGFLGNPNFQSSFLGFNSVLVFSLILSKRFSLLVRCLLAFDLISSIYAINATDSQQGFLLVLGGIAVIILIWISTSRFKVLKVPAWITASLGAAFIGLGLVNTGPLASLLYKPSVTYRGDYWRAGWKMTLEHPFFGVGLDSYGDWYRRARTLEATLRRGPENYSNAAHNVLLDFSSNGGFPLLCIYLSMLFLVVLSSIKVFKRTQEFDPIFSGLFGVWITYQSQSIISINQIGLAVWGWIISGLLIGYEINTRVLNPTTISGEKIKKRKRSSVRVAEKVQASFLIGILTGGLVGLGLGFPPVFASSKQIVAMKSNDAIKLQQSAYLEPLDATNMSRVTGILAENNLMIQALSVSNDSIKKFKDDFTIWSIRSNIKGLSPAQLKEALAQMKRLDPHNPNLK